MHTVQPSVWARLSAYIFRQCPQLPDGGIFLQDDLSLPVREYFQRVALPDAERPAYPFGMTTRPRSSILLTIPVAFIKTLRLTNIFI